MMLSDDIWYYCLSIQSACILFGMRLHICLWLSWMFGGNIMSNIR